jgi:hypothetical protein
MGDLIETFGVVSEEYKLFKEDTNYTALPSAHVDFDSKILELVNYGDPLTVIREINEISRKLFIYGVILESQSRVLQLLEDEFDLWQSKKYMEIDTLFPLAPKTKRTEKEKENLIKTSFEKEFIYYKNLISKEKYKYGIMKRVVSGLESFGYKLHAIKDYNMSPR